MKLIALAICIAIILAAFVLRAPGVTVTVRNSSNATFHDVQVHVTGTSHGLGDIASGASGKCTLRPRGESHVEITYRLADGTTKHHTIDCYFESGYRGTVETDFGENGLLRVSHEVQFSIF